MKKSFYNVTSLEEVLRSFEAAYGLSSEAFYEGYVAGTRPDGLSGFQAHMWASFHREAVELRGDHDFALRAGRLLELA